MKEKGFNPVLYTYLTMCYHMTKVAHLGRSKTEANSGC